jgi:protein phosphatase-4 regulatory subunit 3
LQEQTLEILRLLLDPESVEASVNTFLETFYDNYVDRLVGTLADCLGPKPTSSTAAADGSGVAAAPPPPASPSTLNLIVELLCFCVKSHSYRIKYYVLRNNVVEKVLKLTQRPERFLVVAAVRFLRTCIGLKVLTPPPPFSTTPLKSCGRAVYTLQPYSSTLPP